jgi:hypothetical protein
MRARVSMTRLDRPWHRPGAVRYALHRLPGLLRPPVSVHEPAAGSLRVLRDLPVVVRDGTTLRVNVVLPAGAGPFPVLMSAHPYGKDNLPRRRGRGYRVSFQYRMLRQTAPVRFSSLTGASSAARLVTDGDRESDYPPVARMLLCPGSITTARRCCPVLSCAGVDAKHGVVRSNPPELCQRGPPVDRDMSAGTGRHLEVAPQDRGAEAGVDFLQVHALATPMAQHSPAICGS